MNIVVLCNTVSYNKPKSSGYCVGHLYCDSLNGTNVNMYGIICGNVSYRTALYQYMGIPSSKYNNSCPFPKPQLFHPTHRPTVAMVQTSKQTAVL
jgi:hypothetical protein